MIYMYMYLCYVMIVILTHTHWLLSVNNQQLYEYLPT